MTQPKNSTEPAPIGEIKSALAPVLAKWADRIAALYLFGSSANGQAGPESDIDLAILLPSKEFPASAEIRIGLYADCCRALKRNDIDIVMLNSTRNLFLLNEVVSNGMVLFDREPAFREEFEVKTVHDFIEFREHRKEVLGL